MYNINEVIIAGNITKNLELKSTPSGTKVLSFTLATNRTWKDKNGQKQEDVQYVDFVAFDKQAETLAQYCVKGQNMYCKGRWVTRSWDDKDSGQKRYKTEVILESFQFGNKPQGNSEGGYRQEYTHTPDQQPAKSGFDDFARPPETRPQDEGYVVNAEDIPF